MRQVFITMNIASYSEAKQKLPNGRSVISDPVDVGGHSWRIAFYPNGHLAGTTASIVLFLLLDEDDQDDAIAADEGVDVTYRFMMQQVGGSSVVFRSGKVAATFTGRRNAQGFEHFVSRNVFETPALSQSDRFTIRCHLTVFPPAVETSSSTSSGNKQTDPSAAVTASSAPLSGLQADLSLLLATKEGADVELEEEDTGYVVVGDMSPEAFDALLHYMYTDALPEMAMDSLLEEEGATLAEDLLVAAERYNLRDLKALTEKKLCDRIGVGTVLLLLALAEQYQCSKLKRMCLRFIGGSCSNTKAIVAASSVEGLARSCPSVVKDVIVTILDGREAERTSCVELCIFAFCFIFSAIPLWVVLLVR
ncbi:hypothetical protein BS78_02G028500 [Paspalum vaginatum]|nr:hypothetical protein BS78_02G028500 [Paspalum vaginatum]